jgi:hypothetical protein
LTLLRLFLFAAPRLAATAALGLLAHAVGRRLTRRVPYPSELEKWCFATALGLGALSSLVLLLGALRLLTALAAAAVLLAAALASAGDGREALRELGRLPALLARRRAQAAAAVSLVILLAPALLLALHPPTAWDATLYHLASAQRDVRLHRLASAPEIRFNAFPQVGEMLFALPLLAGDDVTPALLELLMAALAAVSLAAWAKRDFGARAGLWSAAFWLSSPLVLWVATAAYVDSGAALFFLLGTWSAFKWAGTGGRPWLPLAGAMFGYAAATKPSTLVPAALAALAVAAAAARRKQTRGLMGFGAGLLAAAGPWWARSAIETGDPFYPLLAMLGARSGGPLSGADLTNLAGHFRRLPLLPALTGSGGEPPLSPVLLAAAPLIAVFAAFDRRVRRLALACLALLGAWLAAGRDPRFLLPAVALVSLAAGTSADLACGFVERRRGIARSGLFASGAAALILLPGVLFAGLESVRKGLPPSSAAAREDSLSSALPGYRAVRYLNRAAGPDHRVYALFAENLSYFSDGIFLGDWFGPARFGDVLPALSSGRELRRKLAALPADYLLVNRRRLSELMPSVRLPADEDFPRLFEKIYSDGEAEVYRVLTPGSRARGSGRAAPGG